MTTTNPAKVKTAPPLLSPIIALKLVMTAMLWGGTFIAGRVLAQTMPPMSAAFGRFLVAAVLLVWGATQIEGGLPRLNRSQIILPEGILQVLLATSGNPSAQVKQ